MAQNGKAIVDFWEKVFWRLRLISMCEGIYFLMHGERMPRQVSRFSPLINRYVSIQLGIAILIFGTMPLIAESCRVAAWVLTIYGSLRLFELVIHQIDVILFEGYRSTQAGEPYKIDQPERSIILLFYNFAEVILWFATVYIVFPEHFPPSDSGVFKDGTFAKSLGALHSSFTFTTDVGHPSIEPASAGAAVILWIQSIIGLLLILISLARFLNILPAPTRNDPSARKRNDLPAP